MRPIAILVTLLVALPASWAANCPPPPDLTINWIGTLTGCSQVSGPCVASEPINFSATPTNGSFDACHVFDWNFNDGSAHSSLRSPTHLFASTGSFGILLTVSNGQGQSKGGFGQLTVVAATVLPSITEFKATPSRVTPGQSVVFSWTTKNATKGIRIENVHSITEAAAFKVTDVRSAGTATALKLRQTMIYELTAIGDAGQLTNRITVEVVGASRGRPVKH